MTTRRMVIFGLTIGVMLIAGTAFVHKMVDFALTMSGREVEGFGAVAVTTYLVGMVPIVCLLLWATLTGKFADIEAPKYRMLELDREIDRRERALGRGGYHGRA
jgi:nitrogen fixation-related uncharacterized protein